MTKRLIEQERDKIEKSEQIVKDAYYKNSVIEQIVDVKVCDDSETEFLKLGRKIYIPGEWYTRQDIFYDMALTQLGEGIARAEKDLVIKTILENEKIERIKVDNLNVDSFKQTVKRLNIFLDPSVLFAPIDYFVDLTYSWTLNDPDFRPLNFETMNILNKRYNIFWSNKYTPFYVFIFANKEYGEWLTKPSLDKRFYVKISDSDKPESLILTMYTPFKFSIERPDKIKIVEPTNAKKLET